MKAKSLMAKVDPFLESLIHYDKENIHPNIIAALEPYLKDKEFDPDFIRYCMISILSQIAFPFYFVFVDSFFRRKLDIPNGI